MAAEADPGRVTTVSGFHQLPGEAAFCPMARRIVRAVLAERPHIADDAELVVSELFSNACRHTRSGQGGYLGVSVSILLGGLTVVAVADRGPRAAGSEERRFPVPRTAPDNATVPGSRGLFLVARLADEWGRDSNEEGGTTVWAAFRTPPQCA